MNKFNDFINKHFTKIALVMLLLVFFNTCGNPNVGTNKRIDALTKEVDSLKNDVATRKDLQIEGLKAEKRMIQSTDRKMLDVQRQTAIDAELKKLEK